MNALRLAAPYGSLHGFPELLQRAPQTGSCKPIQDNGKENLGYYVTH